MLRLDEKLKRIRAGLCRPSDFITADAKATDMGAGVTGTGFDRSNPGAPRPRSRREFIDQIELIVRQDIVDIMLVSASNLEPLQERGVFAGSGVKPAIRANDTTECWASVRHRIYGGRPSRPFRSASSSRVVTGTAAPAPGAPVTGTDLGLYSITFLNDRDADAAALEAFADFRAEAAANNFKYFYEVFNPNVDCGLSREATGEFLNDCIPRSLAGVMRADRPQFLKITFNGLRALEELAAFDSELVVKPSATAGASRCSGARSIGLKRRSSSSVSCARWLTAGFRHAKRFALTTPLWGGENRSGAPFRRRCPHHRRHPACGRRRQSCLER